MMHFEQLEDRRLLSMTPFGAAATSEPPRTAVSPALATRVTKTAIPRLVGTWQGSRTIIGWDVIPMTLKVTQQDGSGHFTGILTSSISSRLRATITGTIKANRTVTFSFKGTGLDGKLSGQGSGSLSKDGHTLSGNDAFTDAGAGYRSNFKIRK